MEPKPSKRKGVAPSIHGSKRARRTSEEEHYDMSMGKGLSYQCFDNWDTNKCWVIIKNVLKRARVKKGQSFGFGGLLTQFLCGHQIEEEEADYRPIVGHGFEDSIDDDLATKDDMVRVNSNIETSDAERRL
ncbi:hypothetical protein HAX54_052531 [Datura stramonium]|uniref:Uncharacterized protein n=1 Tax=Datura stramonium TaxID=4076 RepID=A0ABS8SZ29_DATST|nr:hypothetical protein [Datura stramonium]